MSEEYNTISREKYEKLKEKMGIWHEKYKQASEHLENENKLLSKTVKTLKKQLYETEDRFKEKITRLETEKILLEGKILQMEESKKDLQERYNELKQDYRDCQRWNGNNKKNEPI
jgi:CII-binding regulator of phage lambda lysogenization HflD